VELPPGEIGEICVTGDHVLKEYVGGEEIWRENKIPVSGEVWHRTGDAGYRDESGMLWLVGRARQGFMHHGRWHFPFIVEDRLSRVEGVAAGTVVVAGGEPVAAVELRGPIDASTLLTRLQSAGIPCERVVVVDAIPRDPRHRSKIDYDKLGRMVVR
jgi:acyl-CoA synthetase (AMP-forming)/AMP-acid ligase II